MEFMEYITENALILIPVLYVIGMFLKALEFIKDKYIWIKNIFQLYSYYTRIGQNFKTRFILC